MVVIDVLNSDFGSDISRGQRGWRGIFFLYLVPKDPTL